MNGTYREEQHQEIRTQIGTVVRMIIKTKEELDSAIQELARITDKINDLEEDEKLGKIAHPCVLCESSGVHFDLRSPTQFVEVITVDGKFLRRNYICKDHQDILTEEGYIVHYIAEEVGL